MKKSRFVFSLLPGAFGLALLAGTPDSAQAGGFSAEQSSLAAQHSADGLKASAQAGKHSLTASAAAGGAVAAVPVWTLGGVSTAAGEMGRAAADVSREAGQQLRGDAQKLWDLSTTPRQPRPRLNREAVIPRASTSTTATIMTPRQAMAAGTADPR